MVSVRVSRQEHGVEKVHPLEHVRPCVSMRLHTSPCAYMQARSISQTLRNDITVATGYNEPRYSEFLDIMNGKIRKNWVALDFIGYSKKRSYSVVNGE